MIKALFIMTSISFVVELFEKNDIEYQEWFDNQNDQYEIRIDLSCLDGKQIKLLKQEINIKEPIDGYSYLIFWK